MPTPSEEYQSTLKRLDELRQRRAVLAAEEDRRRNERDRLRAELSEAGIDVENLDAERGRLEHEVAMIKAESAQLVDEFEAQLDAAEQGRTADEPTPSPGDATRKAEQSPRGQDVEID